MSKDFRGANDEVSWRIDESGSQINAIYQCRQNTGS